MSVIKGLLITKQRRHSCLHSLRRHWFCFKYVCPRFIRIGPTGRISYSQRLTVTARYRIFTGNMFNVFTQIPPSIATNFGARRFPWNLKNCQHLLTCLPVYLSTCLFVYMSACLPVCLSPVWVSTCLLVYLSNCLPVYLSTCLPVYLSTCLPVNLSTCLPVYMSTCLPVYLSTCLRVYVSTCLRV